MRISLLSLALIGLVTASNAGVLTSSLWAVLVAGSKGWENYRHQSDVCHAYHVLINNGVPKERIIVMMYDDIATNSMNSKKGMIFNEPNGSNVYEGVNIDYKGNDVNIDTFKNVLLGNKTALIGRGTGRVLESGKNDHVFINFVDHGSSGMLLFPDQILYATDFIATLKQMKMEGKYGEMVMFIEACEAGSMFDNLLGQFDNILVSTASAPDESSWGWYCDQGTCLGDLYSVAWMNRMEKLNFTESLFEQFDAVRSEVVQKSHVNLYGDYRLGFIQFGKYIEKIPSVTQEKEEKLQRTHGNGINNRDVPLHLAQKEVQNVQFQVSNGQNSREINLLLEAKKQKLQSLIMGRKLADNLISTIVGKLVGRNIELKSEIENNRLTLNEYMFRCYKKLVSEFDSSCFQVSKHYYFLKHLYKFANICVKELNEIDAIMAIRMTCQGLNFNEIII